ncbi:MAG: translocation/assembly module TamB domain-containing protein [Duncaniella sp.]|nr:translocation/assembly module TamB domain-containing protein [Duncaniella sp.]
MCLLIPVLIVPALLYIPFVQDFAVRLATTKINEATGMTINIGKLRLSFPLDLSVDDVTVLQANADTMLTARHAEVSVRLLPLLRSRVDLGQVKLDSAFYQLGNQDSLLWLRANLERGVINGAAMNLATSDISLPQADIEGVRVRLRMLPDSVTAPTDTAAGTPFIIRAGDIRLRRLDYSMEMLPVIDSLGCTIDEARLANATIDLGQRSIYGRSLSIDSVAASYIYPAPSDLNPPPSANNESAQTATDDKLWTIKADSLRLTARRALYARRDIKPSPGFDPSYIEASGITIEIDSFYNQGSVIRLPLRRLDATERCGIPLHAEGLFTMDNSMMKASGFSIETLRSIILCEASLGIGDMASDPSLPVSIKTNGRIDPSDISLAFPALRTLLTPLRPLSFSADIEGTSTQLNIYTLSLSMPQLLRLKTTGTIDHPFDPSKLGGNVSIDGSLAAVNDRQLPFLPIAQLPALRLSGDINYIPGEASGAVEVTTSGGRIAAEGLWTSRSEEYEADLNLDKFPVDIFMPQLGIDNITASLKVDGKGYNPFSRSTSVDAEFNVTSVIYNKVDYRDISADLSLHAGVASGQLSSNNPGADATIDFEAFLSGDTIRYDLNGNIADINLHTLRFTDSIAQGRATVLSKGYYNVANGAMDISASVSDLYWMMDNITISPVNPIDLALTSAPGASRASLDNGDLALRFSSHSALTQFVDSLTTTATELIHNIDSMRIDIRRIGEILPRFDLEASIGRNNVAASFIAGSGIAFNSLNASIRNDSLLTAGAHILRLDASGTRIDTITANIFERGDYLIYTINANSRPGTFDDFAHVKINGYAGQNRASLFVNQHNIKGEQGFLLGLNATITDSILSVNLLPHNPIIAYKKWELNDGNFVSYDLSDRHIDANLRLAQGNSFINIFTPYHTPDEGESIHSAHSEQEDLMIQIQDVALQDWLAINPFAPPVRGNISADLRLGWIEPDITGKGTVTLSDLYYGRDRVGTFGLDLNVETTPGGKLMADVGLMVDSVRTVTARGVLNDSTLSSPFLLDFDMIRFPLSVVNPFLPPGTASLSGMLNGSMKITGDMDSPHFDGFISFDSTAVKATILGTSFKFSNEKIPVDSNIVRFNGFTIAGVNENPLRIDGTVDMRKLSDIRVDLAMKAKEIQVVNSDRARGGADIFGKAWLDVDATVRGSMNYMSVKADLALVEGSNVTYVMSATDQTLQQSGTEDMVKFVQFSDTAQVANADSIVNTGMALNIGADIHIRQGSTVNVNLNPGGSNKVQILPEGDLDFSMTALNGMRLTGRLNLDDGFARYTPPLMSEKNFEIQEGSYIAFNGNIMNPVLNLRAIDVMKANVTQSGQNSRLVNFDVSVAVTGTLEQMNVVFDLSTDDITIQNELTSLSPEQRAQSAINMLLMGTYSGSGTQASTRLNGNPLFSFLTGQLNAWAANNIKGVDISFGVDQYDRTLDGATSTTTSYSYRVSKSLFNDRFKIVVGGNYSTDADADENFAQNLINDISFEYMLNRSGTMYVRIFRHTGFESILEGEITQTGVGFVLKRKINSLRDIFGIRRD